MIFLTLLKSKKIRVLVSENLVNQKLELVKIKQNEKCLSNDDSLVQFVIDCQNYQNYLYKDSCVIRRFLEFIIKKENWMKNDYLNEIKDCPKKNLLDKEQKLIESIQDKSRLLIKDRPIEEGIFEDLHKLQYVKSLLINLSQDKNYKINRLGYYYSLEAIEELRLRVNIKKLNNLKKIIEKIWLRYQANDFNDDSNERFESWQHAKAIKYFFDEVITWKNYNEIFYPNGNFPFVKDDIYSDVNFLKTLNNNAKRSCWKTKDWDWDWKKDIKVESDFGGNVMPNDDWKLWMKLK